jgi:hypothetical protein
VSAIHIDRLTLEVPGLPAADGQRLALLVARGLGTAGAAGGGRDLPSVRVDLTAGSDAGVDELARRVVAAVLEQIERLP